MIAKYKTPLLAVGALAMILAFLAWVVFENRRLIAYAAANALGRGDGPPPSPGTTIP